LAGLFREHAFLSRSNGDKMSALLAQAIEQGKHSLLPGLVGCLVWVEHHLNHKAPGAFSLSRQLVCAAHRDVQVLYGCVDEEESHALPHAPRELDLPSLTGDMPSAAGATAMAALLARLECLSTLLTTYFATFRSVPTALCLLDVLDLARRVHALSAASLPKTAAHRPDFQRLLSLIPQLKASINTTLISFLHGARKALIGRAGELAHLSLKALEDSRDGAVAYRVSAYGLLDATIAVFGVRAYHGMESVVLREMLVDVNVNDVEATSSTARAASGEPAAPAFSASTTSKKKRKYHSEKDDILTNPVPTLRSALLHAALHSMGTVLSAHLPLPPVTRKQLTDHLLSCLLTLSPRLYTAGISQPAQASIHRAQFQLMTVLAIIVTGERVSKVELIPVMRVLAAFLNHGNVEVGGLAWGCLGLLL
jgi:hypothetical protein